LACKIGNLKIVQQLLINGADISAKSLKNGKLAKDSTDNQRIVFLIEKYEKLRALEQEGEDSAGSSGEEAEEEVNAQGAAAGTALLNMLKRQSSQSQLGSSSTGLGQIDEEDQECYDENVLEHLEQHAGSALDQAQQYLDDFQKSRIEVLPVIQGSLFAQGSLNKKQLLRYFRLQADQGILTKFESEQAFANFQAQPLDVLSMTKKARDKSKIEVIYLNKIVTLNHSFRDEFTKQKCQHCLELYYENDLILYLACFDGE